jgi:hypothetical protein
MLELRSDSIKFLNSLEFLQYLQLHYLPTFNKTFARPILSYGSESWIIITDEERLIPEKISFIRRTEGHSFQTTNEMIKGLQIPYITEFTDYKRNCKEQVDRIPIYIF